jgi:hypothetical protein
MGNFKHAAVLAAGLAAMCVVAAPVLAADRTLSLQSFSASRTISAYELSAAGLSGGAVQPIVAASLSGTNPALADLAVAGARESSLASSVLLSPSLALDFGKGLDIATRFSSGTNSASSPFLSAVTAPYTALANGGRYTGITFVPADNLRIRLGASFSDERLDRFHFDASAPTGPLALTYDASQSRSLLGGLSFDVFSGFGVDVTGIASQRSGIPLGFTRDNGLTPRSTTAALDISAHMDFGRGWVTTASFSEGMTQLDPQIAFAGGTLREQSYSVSIAKRGVFGDDVLGLAFSRPAPSMSGSFSALSAVGDMPLTVAPRVPLNRAQETDIQVGYVTNFLDGAVALQTNAAYQTNTQGQPGATSVSLLSRAKIKF